MNDAELIAEARARVRAYIDRRAIAKGYDPEYIHGYDVSKSSPNGIALTVPDLTTLLDALEAAQAKLAEAVKLIDLAVELARWDRAPKLRDDMIDFTTEIKGESHE